LEDYAAHAQELRLQQGEIRPSAGTAISGGAEPGGSGDNDMESPDYSSMLVAELKQELRSWRLRSGGTKPQLLKRLLDDDAKHAEVQDGSSDSGRGSGNNSDSEYVRCPSSSNAFVALLGLQLAQPKRVLFWPKLTCSFSRFFSLLRRFPV
jgi:hypothetical protein